jgi:nitrate reductase gamma subunit
VRLLPVRPDHVRFCATGKQAKSQRRQHRLRHGSKRMLAMRAYMFVIFLGHFVGLLTPIRVFDGLGISHTSKQWMAIRIGGLASAMLIP